MKQTILFCALFIGLVVAVFGQIDTKPAFNGIRESNGTITITKYDGKVKDVIIPEKFKISEKEELTVGAIGNEAFSNKELTSVTIPNGVTSIGRMAFHNNKLTNVIIGNSVTSINSYAFYSNKLTNITIGANVSIASLAFEGAFRTFYNRGGKKAGTYVLQGRTYTLQEAESPKTAGGASDVVKINPAFEGIKEGNRTITITKYNGTVKDVIIPEKVKISENEELPVGSIGKNVFSNGQDFFEKLTNDKRLTSVTIPNGVTSIGEKAFANNKLTSVTIPNSVTSIDEKAFENNQLTSITIGANVSIDFLAFDGSFRTNYNRGGKKAGTYVLRVGRFVLQE